jgi:hypothetical protein
MPQSGLAIQSTAGILHIREQATHRGLIRKVYNLYGTANLQMIVGFARDKRGAIVAITERVVIFVLDLIAAANKLQLACYCPGRLHSFHSQPAHLESAHIDRITPKQQRDDCKNVTSKQITEKKNRRNPSTTMNIPIAVTVRMALKNPFASSLGSCIRLAFSVVVR